MPDPSADVAALSKSPLGQLKASLLGLWSLWAVRVFVAGAIALMALVAAAASGDPPGPFRVLRIVASVTDAAAAVLWAGALGIGLLLLYRDVRSGFEPFTASEPVSSLSYAIGKAGAGLVAYAALLAVIAVEIAALLMAAGAGYIVVEELGHLVLVAAGILPFVLLMEIAATVLPVYFSMLPVLVVIAMSNDFALDRGRAITGLLDVTPFVSFEKAAYWVLPRALIDPMTREILVARATYLNDFPGDSNNAVFGGSLVLVSQAGDYIYWAAYLVVLCVLLYLAIRWRERRARAIIHVSAFGRYVKE